MNQMPKLLQRDANLVSIMTVMSNRLANEATRLLGDKTGTPMWYETIPLEEHLLDLLAAIRAHRRHISPREVKGSRA
jgi:hypothetical protein